MRTDSTYRPDPRDPAGDAAAPPVPGRAALQEAFAGRAMDASATGFVLAVLPAGTAPILWVQDRSSRREGGRPYLPGAGKPAPLAPILRVEVSHPRDVLWTMEEGAACAGLSAVVGEIHGDPAVLDFTATKRLALRAEASGVPVWLIRTGGAAGLSAARERWRIGALPSSPHPHDPAAPGAPLWAAELFRARGRPPGRWEAHREPGGAGGGAADRLRLVPPPRDRAVAPGRSGAHAAGA